MNNKEKLTQHISQQFNQDLEAVRSNFPVSYTHLRAHET